MGSPQNNHAAFASVATSCSGVLFDSLSLVQRSQKLLTNFSAVVAPGEFVTVVGPSGAGKTTLLRTLAGLIEPAAGSIVRPPGRVSMVFQDPRLLPWRTAIQNIEVVLERHERRLAKEWLERVGLGDAANVYPAALSGGMRQRVAIARALAAKAPVVLVDEPFSNLDVVTAKRLRHDLTTQLRAGGHTVFWVTHNPAEAAEVGDRTLAMEGPPHGSWQLN